MSDEQRGERNKQPSPRTCWDIAPWHTFLFRQNTAAQAQQRGETDPLHKTGCHRGLFFFFFDAPGVNVSLHANNTRYSALPKLQRSLRVARWDATFPSLGNFDSSSSSQISPQLRARGARGHTSGRSDVSKREDRCASLTAQVEAGRRAFIKKNLSYKLVFIGSAAWYTYVFA